MNNNYALARAPEHHMPTANTPAFALRSPRGSLICDAVRTRLAPGCAADLATRVTDFFAADPQGPGLLVGALPFDRRAPDHLFQPRQVRRQDPRQAHGAPARTALDYRWRLVSAEAPNEYATAVARVLRMLEGAGSGAAALSKIVLARYIELEAEQPVDIAQVARKLAHDHRAAAFTVQLPAGTNPHDDAHRQRYLVGASPELLVAKTGSQVRSHPLAGSARRGRTAAEDHAAGQALLHSDKDQREHRAVVEAILDTLAPYCAQLSSAPRPALMQTDTLWHLGTPITGVLRNPDTSCAELAAALHPTPAVCGLPRARARAAIDELEPFDRGFYAGAVGWTDAAGDGAWHVSIRCAEIAAARVRLYAGAGIVRGSDPIRETRETAAKFAVMLKALGVDETELNGVLEAVA